MNRLVLGLAALLVACGGGGTAKSSSPAADPGCTGASCCGLGWHWQVLAGCTQIAPPYCGCYCSGPEPEVYSTMEACEAAHPARTDAHSPK